MFISIYSSGECFFCELLAPKTPSTLAIVLRVEALAVFSIPIDIICTKTSDDFQGRLSVRRRANKHTVLKNYTPLLVDVYTYIEVSSHISSLNQKRQECLETAGSKTANRPHMKSVMFNLLVAIFPIIILSVKRKVLSMLPSWPKYNNIHL